MATLADRSTKRKQSPPADDAAEHDRPTTSSDDCAEAP
jgi:hypothetical protein